MDYMLDAMAQKLHDIEDACNMMDENLQSKQVSANTIISSTGNEVDPHCVS